MIVSASFRTAIAALLFCAAAWLPGGAVQSPATIDERVDALLARMTLEEKIGQMNMPCGYMDALGKNPGERLENCRRLAAGTRIEGVGPMGGFFTLADNLLHEGPRQQAEFFNELQRIALEKTRLKIPLLQTEEGTHGLMCSGGTVFPEGLALGSTWNMDLIDRIYHAAAREARAVGIHQLYTLVIEPNRDPRLGRNMEGYSEDPYLCARIAAAIVRGAQGGDVAAPDRVVAGLCHYPGQSQGVSGLERGAMAVSERALRQVFLPPWVAGIRQAGALGVMATYPAIDGVPTHGSARILTGILRDELGFKGLVLSEGSGIGTLVHEKLAASQKEAGILAIHAGVDVGISYESGYMNDLAASVREGRVPMALLDRAVRRILRLKFQLGLFERPYVDAAQARDAVPRLRHRELALEAAQEGIVLLKNEKGLLPLRKDLRSIAVIGTNADHQRNQLGDYTSKTILQQVVTVLDGIKAKVSPRTQIQYVKGCDVLSTDASGIAKARDAARQADVAIVVVGENEREAPDEQGTDGEGRDVASLDLSGLQEDLIRAVHSTGTPTIVVLINGRPLSTRWAAEQVPAILEAWIPGERGGDAIAGVIFGDYNPSGRLPITIPRHVGQLPMYYNYEPAKAFARNRRGYVDMPASPLFAFGHGLSYTTFAYSGLSITPAKIGKSGRSTVRVRVKNTGSRRGAEVVQLYVNDVLGSVATPVQELKGFEKVWLDAGEQREVAFTLGPDELSLINARLERVVEPGRFEVMVGSSSQDVRLKGQLEVAP